MKKYSATCLLCLLLAILAETQTAANFLNFPPGKVAVRVRNNPGLGLPDQHRTGPITPATSFRKLEKVGAGRKPGTRQGKRQVHVV